MKINPTDEWWMKMAELEGDSEIAAGALARDPAITSDIAGELFYKHWPTQNPLMADEAQDLVRAVVDDITRLRPIDEWEEEMNDVLCWTVPCSESPVITSPISSDYPESTTHFSELLLPSNLSADGFGIVEG